MGKSHDIRDCMNQRPRKPMVQNRLGSQESHALIKLLTCFNIYSYLPCKGTERGIPVQGSQPSGQGVFTQLIASLLWRAAKTPGAEGSGPIWMSQVGTTGWAAPAPPLSAQTLSPHCWGESPGALQGGTGASVLSISRQYFISSSSS